MYISGILLPQVQNLKKESSKLAKTQDFLTENELSLSNLPNKQDLVFKSMLKKSHFKGIDLAVVEKYKVPIQNFNKVEQLQNWAKANFLSLGLQTYKAKSSRATYERKQILKEWFNYLESGNEAYSNALKFFIFSSLVGVLKEDDNNLPPALNPGVLAETVTEINERLAEKGNAQVNFNDIYKHKMQEFLIKDDVSNIDTDMTGWIEIPSKRHDSANFENNVKKLQALSHKNWCTKTFNAKPYLEKGDFHIYLENGKPKLGVRFSGDKICEIEGEKNNQKIPEEYFDIFKAHRESRGYELIEQAKKETYNLEVKLPLIRKIKAELGSAVELNSDADYEKIFNYLGIKFEKNSDDLYILSGLKSSINDVSLEEIGCDMQKLLDRIVKIEGDAEISDSNIKEIKNLTEIGGNVLFNDGITLETLGSLTKIGGDLTINDCCICSLGNLKYIGGSIVNKTEYLHTLGLVEEIGGNVDFSQFDDITTVENLKKIGGHVELKNSNVSSLGSLEEIGGDLNIEDIQVRSLGNLKEIKGDFYCIGLRKNLKIKNLKTVRGDVVFEDSRTTSLGSLETIGGDLELIRSDLEDIGKLKTVKGCVSLGTSRLYSWDFDGVDVRGPFIDEDYDLDDEF